MEKVRLGDVCTIKGGYAFKSDQFSTEGVPVIRIGNITKEGLTIDEDVCYDKKFWNENDSYRIAKNDILIAMSGATVGKSCINNTERNLLLNQRVAAINCDNNINLKYIFYSIGSEKFSKYIMTNSIGCAQPNISLKQIANFEIPAVCLEEQNRIADELDKVTDVINKRKQQISKLDELVKARFVELFGDPVDNPMEWATKQLQELVTDDCTISYGIVQTGDDQKEGIPVLRPVDIVNRIPVRSELKKTTEEISNKYKRTILKGREMLITVRANIADTCIVGEEFTGCNVGRGIVPIRTREDEMILEFLKYQIDSKHLNDNIKALAKGITLIQLNMEDLREVTLIVPPIEQQKSFVEFAKQIDKSKAEVQKALDKAQLLFDSLMQEYFG